MTPTFPSSSNRQIAIERTAWDYGESTGLNYIFFWYIFSHLSLFGFPDFKINFISFHCQNQLTTVIVDATIFLHGYCVLWSPICAYILIECTSPTCSLENVIFRHTQSLNFFSINPPPEIPQFANICTSPNFGHELANVSYHSWHNCIIDI